MGVLGWGLYVSLFWMNGNLQGSLEGRNCLQFPPGKQCREASTQFTHHNKGFRNQSLCAEPSRQKPCWDQDRLSSLVNKQVAGRAAPRDFLRAKPKENLEGQPCQPKENPVLPDSFIQIYIIFVLGFFNYQKQRRHLEHKPSCNANLAHL